MIWQLSEQFNIEINRANTFWGPATCLYIKLTAHNLCIYLNRLLDNLDSRHIKKLAFPIYIRPHLEKWLTEIFWLVGEEDIQLVISIAPIEVQRYADTQFSIDLDKPQIWLADIAQAQYISIIDPLMPLRS